MTQRFILPKSYSPRLTVLAVEEAIKAIKDHFQDNLAEALALTRVTAPMFVESGTGINDDLNGVEAPVRFHARGAAVDLEIVQSLAKWKRLALGRYGFGPGRGLYTDMNAIRPDETVDSIHSIYVDQWDWEKVIEPAERTRESLEATVRAIYDVICRTEFFIASRHSSLRPILPAQITFVTSEELQQRYPDLRPRQREDRIAAEHGAVFVIGIGAALADGEPHDGRAPDYDDWISERPDGGRGLNGDLILWNPVLERAFEISSMGIRVNPETLRQQLAVANQEERQGLRFHAALLAGELPQTMGGGIGQSRLCMFYLRAAHIGEVACGVWPEAMQQACREAGVFLL